MRPDTLRFEPLTSVLEATRLPPLHFSIVNAHSPPLDTSLAPNNISLNDRVVKYRQFSLHLAARPDATFIATMIYRYPYLPQGMHPEVHFMYLLFGNFMASLLGIRDIIQQQQHKKYHQPICSTALVSSKDIVQTKVHPSVHRQRTFYFCNDNLQSTA